MDISSPVDEAVSAETAATIILGAMLITKSKYFSLPFSLPRGRPPGVLRVELASVSICFGAWAIILNIAPAEL